MSVWWTYRPEDFLLFSERVYWRLFELHNDNLWPAQFIALALGAIVLALLFKPEPWSSRVISTTMTMAWAFVAGSYLWDAYATINWAARYIAPFFILEAFLFAWLGAIRNRLSFAPDRRPRSILRVALVVYAIFLHPLIAVVAGRPIGSTEIFALTPDPTAIATLGLLGLSRGGGVILLLLLVPMAWCLVSWATLQTMGTWEAWIPLAALVFVILTRPWRQAPTSQ